MNFSKLDAGLSAALDGNEGSTFSVFVRFTEPLSQTDAWALRSFGLIGNAGETIVNGSLASGSIDKLSHWPMVGSIRLSGNRHLY